MAFAEFLGDAVKLVLATGLFLVCGLFASSLLTAGRSGLALFVFIIGFTGVAYAVYQREP